MIGPNPCHNHELFLNPQQNVVQMAPLLAKLDFDTTGMPDLFVTYEPRLYERTFVSQVDATGLVNTSTGRHLVGWDPAPTSDMFVNNEHTSVCNGWAIHGLEALADMAAMVSATPRIALSCIIILPRSERLLPLLNWPGGF